MSESIETDLDAVGVERVFANWLEHFTTALVNGDAAALRDILAANVSWRDFMAFSWDFDHALDRDETAERLATLAKERSAENFAVSAEQRPFLDKDVVNGFFDFTTDDRLDRGYVRLTPDGSGWVAEVLQTQVVHLRDFPERTRHHRAEGKVYGIVPNRTRWSDDRHREAAFEDTDPAVLILGAGHNGLSLAARLGVLDVPTLVIDKRERVGDAWRKRYASLALHSTVYGDHLPYLPLPVSWPAHTPRDKFADWLETYVKSLDLNVWTSSTFIGGHYDEDEQRWTVHIQREDGSVRTMHPRHFIVAGGFFGPPRIPEIPGLESFQGLHVHSDEFQDGANFAGKKALVIGSGVSGHELAHDLWEHGADVTMVQRSSTYVVTYDSYHKYWSTLFTEDMTLDPDFADQMAYALPRERTRAVNQRLVKLAAEDDRELLDALQGQGFQLNWGPDGAGIIGARMSGKDSYQIDIGASQLIADGRVQLKQGVEVAEIRDGHTVVFTDRTTMHADLIVFATGYQQFWDHIKPTLGAAAHKIDEAYQGSADVEYESTWRRTAQPGLWFATGFIRMARFYSRFTALMIKAIEEGIEPIDPVKKEDR